MAPAKPRSAEIAHLVEPRAIVPAFGGDPGDSSESPGGASVKTGTGGSGLTDLPPVRGGELEQTRDGPAKLGLGLGLFNLTTARFRRSYINKNDEEAIWPSVKLGTFGPQCSE